MLKGLPTALIVTAVALAIWMVAEAESVRSEPVTALVAIESAGSAGRIARPDPRRRWDSQVSITLEGSAGALDGLKRRVPQSFNLSPGSGLREEPGVYEQDLRTALSALEPFASSGVTIREVDPPMVTVEIAEQESEDVVVELDTSGVTIDGTWTIDPPRVRIQGPASTIQRLGPQSRAIVRLSAADVARLVPGRTETINEVRVSPPTDVPLADLWGGSPITPATVKVNVTLRAQSGELTIPSLGVLLCLAPVDFNDWIIEVTDENKFLKDVVLTGPRAEIDRVARGDWRLDALVRLSFDDLEKARATGRLSVEAEIGPLPPGVSSRCEDKVVDMTVRPGPGATERAPTTPDAN